VEYLPFGKFDREKNYDVLVVWREAGIGMLDFPLKADRIILELQDILQSDDDLSSGDLLQIGNELLGASQSAMHEANLLRILAMVESGKLRRMREVQNVFLEHLIPILKVHLYVQ
jgi:hypothetical protein